MFDQRHETGPRSSASGDPRLLVVIFLLALWAGAARAQDEWSGAWNTFRPDDAVRLLLTQDGSVVTGTYLPGDGDVQGTVTGRELVGAWSDSAGNGSFRIGLSGDGSTFFGLLGNGQWWTGQRAEAAEDDADFEADRSSPRAVLRSFLIAANNVRIEKLAYLGAALSCLDQESDADPASAHDRRGRAHLFFDVLDHTTLRLADVPDRTGEAEVTLSLRQAGTDVTVELVVAGATSGGSSCRAPPSCGRRCAGCWRPAVSRRSLRWST